MEKYLSRREVEYIEFKLTYTDGKSRIVADQLRQEFVLDFDKGRRNFWIDFYEVLSVCSSLIGAVAFICQKVSGDGKVIIAGANDSIREVFQITGIDLIKPIEFLESKT